ncbi:MAG: endonuclease/exonuclease/phosphatase family protein [Deltaproteobacteria bacterium]|nr:endonuclease/exonuclease/phosphatase family protein [Deltaproteobacteria bacterium]
MFGPRRIGIVARWLLLFVAIIPVFSCGGSPSGPPAHARYSLALSPNAKDPNAKDTPGRGGDDPNDRDDRDETSETVSGSSLASTSTPTAGSEFASGSESESASRAATMRIVAANLTSGTRQSWDPGHGTRILKALAPDIVLIQEFRVGNNTEADLRAFVDDAFGPAFVFCRENNVLPNGIISRWPLRQAGVWRDAEVADRNFSWAEIDLPGSTDLWAVSVHLLSSSSTKRQRQASALMRLIAENIPSNALVVIGGDLNTRTSGERALDVFASGFELARQARDRRGNPNTNAGRNRPYDWVMPNYGLDALQIDVVFESQSYPDGFVFDTRLYASSSSSGSIEPALPRDSAAQGMQHMAVVRDFRRPN